MGVCGKDARDGGAAGPAGPRGQGHRACTPTAPRSWARSDREVDVFVDRGALHHGDQRQLRPASAWRRCSARPPAMRDKAKAALRARPAARPARRRRRSTARPPGSPPSDLDGLVAQGEAVAHRQAPQTHLGDDVTGLQELLTYGLKGTAAYADHAQILGQEDDARLRLLPRGAGLPDRRAQPTSTSCWPWSCKCGEVNLKVMELLDAANTGAYGHPVPTPVRVTPVKGKAILVSGHDLKDLEELLKQTEGKGINVYTHGEMLPAHGYPGPEEVQAPGRQLRRRVAGPAQGVRRLPRRDPDDHQLHPEAARTATRTASSPAAWSPGRACSTSPTATSRR